jgi:hypothetical protein
MVRIETETESAVRLRHLPSGIVVSPRQQLSQHQNKTMPIVRTNLNANSPNVLCLLLSIITHRLVIERLLASFWDAHAGPDRREGVGKLFD